MLRRKKLEPCLYERQRRAKFVRRIAGELPLRVKRLRQTVEHSVDRPAQLPELGGRVLGQTGVGQAFLVDLPGLPRKIAQRLERPRPLTKYAMTALSSVTSAVMHQPMRSKRTFSALTC